MTGNLHMFSLAIYVLVLQLALQSPVEPDEFYRDNRLHFTFTYPSILVNTASQPALDKLKQEQTDSEQKQAISCTTAPLAAIHMNGRLFDEAMILRLDLDCLHERIGIEGLPEFTRAMITQTVARHGKAELHGQAVRKLAGHDSFIVEASVDERAKASGGILLATALCSLVDHSIVCWQVLSYSESTERDLLSHTVTFDGHAPEPLMLMSK